MRYILGFFFLLTFFKTMHSQGVSLEAYFYEWNEFKVILLLGCNQGYFYSGPSLLIDEVFTYEKKSDIIIRKFDSDYSLKPRTDTLSIRGKLLVDTNGFRLKKVRVSRQKELMNKYIIPSADAGFYNIFLKRLESCSAN